MDEIAATGPAVVDKWAERIAEAAAQYGPDAVELASALGTVGAAQEVVGSVVFLVIAILIGWSSRTVLKKAVEARRARRSDFDDGHFPVFIAFGGMCLTAFIMGVVALEGVLNFYAWAGLFRPEVFLAAKALGL